MKISIIDEKGNKSGEIDLKNLIDTKAINNDLITQYVRVYQMNQRQGTSKTKTRSEVRGGGKKPYRQKGTGRARAGSNRSPLWRGGGVIHGPIPKSWSLKITKRMNKKVFNDVLVQKVKDNSCYAFSFGSDAKPDISTKNAMQFLKAAKIDGSLLVIHHTDDVIFKSFRNLPNVMLSDVKDLNAYQILSNQMILIQKEAVSLLEERL